MLTHGSILKFLGGITIIVGVVLSNLPHLSCVIGVLMVITGYLHEILLLLKEKHGKE